MVHKENAINYLWHKAKSEDFYTNLDDALNLLVDADDRLHALKKYFPEEGSDV